MAADFDKRVLTRQFGKNFHVRYPTVFERQKEDLVLVKGGPGSRLFRKATKISEEGKDRAGKADLLIKSVEGLPLLLRVLARVQLMGNQVPGTNLDVFHDAGFDGVHAC